MSLWSQVVGIKCLLMFRRWCRDLLFDHTWWWFWFFTDAGRWRPCCLCSHWWRFRCLSAVVSSCCVCTVLLTDSRVACCRILTHWLVITCCFTNRWRGHRRGWLSAVCPQNEGCGSGPVERHAPVGIWESPVISHHGAVAVGLIRASGRSGSCILEVAPWGVFIGWIL